MTLTKPALHHRLAWAGLFLSTLGWWVTIPNSARAAERVYVSYGILERSIPVSSLDAYARDGTIDEDLAVYAQYGDAKQLKQLKSVLVARADVDLIAVSQFLYTPQGEVLLKRLGQVIQPESRDADSSFKAIRAALILAAADPDGLTLLNILRHFPTRGLRIDVARSLQIAASLEQLVNQTKRATTVLIQAAQQEQSADPVAVNQLADLRQRGPFTWRKQTLPLVDPSRSAENNSVLSGSTVAQPARTAVPPLPSSSTVTGRSIPVDLYLPNQKASSSATIPVIVISHGLGSDRGHLCLSGSPSSVLWVCRTGAGASR